jgi:polyhydroxybutyrate depolymerase
MQTSKLVARATRLFTLGLSSVASLAILTTLGLSACERADAPPLDPEPPTCRTLELDEPEPGDLDGQIAVGGRCRDFRLHIPPAYAAGEPLPMLLGLHGYGGFAPAFAGASGMSSKADAAGFVAVYPQGLGNPASWNVEPLLVTSDDVGFLRALIVELSSRLRIDRRRVYITGFSNGGGMANRAACDLADVVAAVAPVSGSYQDYQVCHPTRPVPVVALHGAADNVIPPAGQPANGWPPIMAWVDWWVVQNGCRAEPTLDQSTPGVSTSTWEGCQDGARVRLVVIGGWGHAWPRGPRPGPDPAAPIDGMDTVWAFLSQHALPR